MEKYEYKIVPFLYTELEDLELMLKAMGNKGWELSAIRDNYYIFKRPQSN
jgi:hypothetical protein